MYKILHTADWHLGQTFKGKSRLQEHAAFINWLLITIQQEQLDAVIIAGDVFDVFNPSVEAMDLYHHFLAAAFKINVPVIVLGGNHDSAARLNTTGELLKLLNMHVVGGDSEALGQIIPLYANAAASKPDVVVVAVPYLRDGDVRKISSGEGVLEAQQLFLQSVQMHYQHLLQQAKQQYPDVAIITTGHLYITGSITSDPEKDSLHKVGTLGTLPTSVFDAIYGYVALGHIHKAQTLPHPQTTIVRYAGSPIALNFSEREDEKTVTIITINEHQIQYSTLPIPQSRRLIRWKGNSEQILESIRQHQSNSTLTDWGEVVLTEPTDFVVFNQQLIALAEERQVEIIDRLMDLGNQHNDLSGVRNRFHAALDNNPLDDVEQIFKLRCMKFGLNDDGTNALLPLFKDALQAVQTPNE